MVWHYTTADSGTAGSYTDLIHSGMATFTTANHLHDWDHIMTTGTTTASTSITSCHSHTFTLYPTRQGTYPTRQGTYPTRQEISLEQRTQEQIEQERINQELLNKRKAENDAIEKVAKEKARVLLLEYLDNENKQRLLENKPLEIVSKLFKYVKYHIPISYGRIKARKENKIITELCLAVREPERLPLEDVILTKLLHVSNDEKNMLKTANHFNVQENLLTGLN